MTEVISELFEMSGHNKTEGAEHSPQTHDMNDHSLNKGCIDCNNAIMFDHV